MASGPIKRMCAAAAGAMLVLGSIGLFVAPASAAPAPAVQDRSCADYIPRDLAINVPSAAPGETVTITGLASPGDTVTIRIAQLAGPPIVLATAVADSNGYFSANITIPANYAEGTYNITVSSPNCDGVGTITLVVRFPGGRCTDRRTVEAQRGDSVEWTLLGVLDTTKPLTVTLVPLSGGPSVVVYTGAYPASGDVTFTVPASLPDGRYRIVESGTGKNGKPLSARCGRLRVRGGGGGTTCETGGQTFNFDATVKLIDWDGFNPKVEYTPTIPVNLAAGTWNISSATARDSYPNRVNVTQTSEVWEIEFLDSSGAVLARSQPTQDVPDMVDPGVWTGPLGAVVLPAGVVSARAHHLPDLYPDAPFEPANSVYAISFTICHGGGGGGESSSTSSSSTSSSTPTGDGGASPTTLAPILPSTPPSAPAVGNIASPTAAQVAVADQQATRISSQPTRVAGTSTSRSGSGATGLAATGSTVRPYIVAAVALIAAGALFVMGARRRREV